MKKLLPFLFLSCVSTIIFAQPVFKSLNGYDESVAKAMIAPFNNTGHQKPQKTSVWFDRTMIQNMITLINSESSTRRPVDGVRIYLALDKDGNKTIVLVSTYNSNIYNNESFEGDNYHYDYWDHSSSAALFNMNTSINGEPCHDDCKGGALLYKKSGLHDDVSCDINNPHYLSRSLCEDMVISYTTQAININSRSEWFDIDMINGFIKMFQNRKVDGIRVYFAQNLINYPYTYYGGMDTFVIVPTTGSSTDSNFHQDYFDCSFASDFFKRSVNKLKTQLSIKLRNYFSEKSDEIRKTMMLTGSYGGQDNGQLCPFNCN